MFTPVRPTIVVVAGDAGGANALAPVILAIQAGGQVSVEVLAYREAAGLWARRGIAVQPLAESTTLRDGLDRLRRANAALVLTGTSMNSIGLENVFIAAARQTEIPSVSLLDFWSNYARRFMDGSGQPTGQPNLIAIMDERARDEMIAEGFDPSRLVVTGQPAFDDLDHCRRQCTPEVRERIRKGLGVPAGGRLVLFASQPISTVFGESVADPLFCGYTERTVARALVSALERIAERRGVELILAIRLHPREEPGALEELCGRRVRIMRPSGEEGRTYAMAADLVTGMTTMLLVEACYLGCLTLSMQPGLRRADPLPTNRQGVSQAVYREEEIEPAIERLLWDNSAQGSLHAKLDCLRLDGGATERVVQLVHRMLKPTADCAIGG